MVFTMERRECFSSAHRLHNPQFSAEKNKQVYGKCNHANGHGHNYVWRVVLKGDVDPQTGMLYDLADLKKEISAVVDVIDHRNIDIDVPYFKNLPSTSENVVRFLFESLKEKMSRPDLLWECILHETEKNVFTYNDRS